MFSIVLDFRNYRWHTVSFSSQVYGRVLDVDTPYEAIPPMDRAPPGTVRSYRIIGCIPRAARDLPVTFP